MKPIISSLVLFTTIALCSCENRVVLETYTGTFNPAVYQNGMLKKSASVAQAFLVAQGYSYEKSYPSFSGISYKNENNEYIMISTDKSGICISIDYKIYARNKGLIVGAFNKVDDIIYNSCNKSSWAGDIIVKSGEDAVEYTDRSAFKRYIVDGKTFFAAHESAYTSGKYYFLTNLIQRESMDGYEEYRTTAAEKLNKKSKYCYYFSCSLGYEEF